MRRVKACDLADLEADEILKVEIDGEPPIAMYLVDGEVLATHDTCTHGEASLSEDGYIEDGKVICSWHEGGFDIRTGLPCRLPCMDPIRTFVVDVVDGEVFLTFND